MSKPIVNQRDIIDRRALSATLDAIAADGEAGGVGARALALAELKIALAKGRAELRTRFVAAQDGSAYVREMTFLIDQLVRVIHDHAERHLYPAANPTKGETLAIVAVGGYGRNELCPHSDVDLLFVRPYKPTPRGEQIVEYILYMLWDLGLKVGHATRSVDDCLRHARDDMTIRTALLESRFVWGDEKLYAGMRAKFFSQIVAGSHGAFMQAKLTEREARHKRMGDSRYVVEPNVKDGKGGLRDLHTLFWIAKYRHRVASVEDLVAKTVISAAEAAEFEKARHFLLTVRCHMHDLTNRPEERLTFDIQREIAQRMGYTDHAGSRGVERLMKHYYLVAKTVGDLTGIFCAALEIEAERRPGFMERITSLLPKRTRTLEGFVLENERLSVANDNALAAAPAEMVRIFHVAWRHGLTVHPKALRAIRQNLRLIDAHVRADEFANRLFLDMLTAREGGEVVLRAMNEAGVFGRFVPDFGRVVAQSQHDMYHVYTVDEHTIFAIGILAKIEAGALKEEHPIASEVIHQLQSRRALYVAVLLHDIAKGRGGDHSILGADVAYRLCPRLGLSPEETETVAWLVRYHLAMSNTAFKRDIHDPQTIADFAGLVQSPERLRLLLCLTVADIKAVGPNVWNNWKAALLRELYYRAEEALLGVASEDSAKLRVAAAQTAMAELLADWSADEIAAHRARAQPAYWLSYDSDTLARHARLIRDAERRQTPLSVDTRIDRARAVTEITIYTADHPGLFARIAGAMAIAGANIVGAQIFTTSEGMALDTFLIQEAGGAGEGAGHAFDRPERLARLATAIEHAHSGRIKIAEALKRRPAVKSRTEVFTVPPRVFVDNAASRTHTVIEVNGRDRTGLLHELTHALTSLGLSINTAKIATYGEQAVDVFYVRDVFGLKIDEEPKLKRIRERLLAVLAGGAVDAALDERVEAAE